MKLAVIVAIAASFIVSFAFLFPIFSQISNWGLYDWDQHFFYHGSARASIVDFGQVPLWTPYYCGGTPLLANPQSVFLSPFFSFVMLFGTVAGLKLEILVYLALGLVGTFLVARKMGCGNLASAFAAVVFMMSSWFSSRIVVGHTTLFSFALLPFAFLAFISSSSSSSPASRIRWCAVSAFFLAMMFFSGGIYPVYASIILLVIYSILDLVSSRKLAPSGSLVLILVFAALLCSVKLLPVFDFASGVQDSSDIQLNSPIIVMKSLVWHDQSIQSNDRWTGRDLMPEGRQKYLDTLGGKVAWSWHEYSAYVGIIPLLLALVASALAFKRNWKLVVSAVFFLLLALGSYIPFGPWQLIRHIPLFSSLHGPSRFIPVLIFLIALLAARALTSVRMSSNNRAQSAVLAFMLILVFVDLFLVSRPLIADAFPQPPISISQTAIGTPVFIQMLSSAPEAAQYNNLQQGIGTLNCYERLHLKPRATPQLVDDVPYKNFMSNAYLAESNQSVNLTYFSPQIIELTLPEVSSDSTLVLNENYYKGWFVNGVPATSFNGLISTRVFPSDSGKEVRFSFSSRPFSIGLVISAISSLFLILLLIKPGLLSFALKAEEKLQSYVFRQS